MTGNLALLHRYTLVRTHVKIGNHQQAAKLLIQVAVNISRFPARMLNYSVYTYKRFDLMNHSGYFIVFHRYNSNINIDSYRVPSCWFPEGRIFLCINIDETRKSQSNRHKVYQENRRNCSKGAIIHQRCRRLI